MTKNHKDGLLIPAEFQQGLFHYESKWEGRSLCHFKPVQHVWKALDILEYSLDNNDGKTAK
jgi:hypothetical protein